MCPCGTAYSQSHATNLPKCAKIGTGPILASSDKGFFTFALPKRPLTFDRAIVASISPLLSPRFFLLPISTFSSPQQQQHQQKKNFN
jgi:hypothetical protein